MYIKYIIYDTCLYELKLTGSMYVTSAKVDNLKLLRVVPQELITLLLMTGVDLLNIPAELVDNIMAYE